MGNIIGDPIHNQILKQVKNRQKMSGAGYNSESIKRDPQVLNYLNNRNSWIKMASGVSISGSLGEEKIRAIFEQSPDQTATEQEYANLQDTGLAKNMVLFNTIQSFNDGKYTPRSGVRNNNLLNTSTNKMYGGLGGNSQGLQPVGGITGISIEDVNRGSIRKGKVSIKVYNQFQFNLIELLYLRLGYIMMLEWGWDKYVSNIETIEDSPDTPPKVTIEQMGSTIIEEDWFDTNTYTQRSMLSKIKAKRLQTQGNYDAFFGKVSNFSWSVNIDGSYNIEIDLITLGSVVESLNVKTPAIQLDASSILLQQNALADKLEVDIDEDGKYESDLVNNIGSNVISQWLGQTILNFPKNDTNYMNLTGLSRAANAYNLIPANGSYFIRLGEFLSVLESKIFKDVKNGGLPLEKQVEIDTGLNTNKCNYVLNLIPLDPGVCIFNFQFDKTFQEISYLPNGFNGGTTYYKTLNPFVVQKEDVVYGKLMNIYMNINFLQSELENNVNEKNELSLYQYLQSICNGINKSTGNTTNLEPAIRDDRIIYFLEQNPIKGLDSLKDETDIAPIEILGYNSSGESTFVSDFKFNTKITPDLMNIISIGATSNGKTAESLPFNKWNEGLMNRFEESLTDPPPPPKEKTVNEEGLTDPDIIIAQFQKDMREDQDSWFGTNVDYDAGTGYDWEWKTKNINDISYDSGFFNTQTKDSKDPVLLDEVVRRVHKLERELKDEGVVLVDRTQVDDDGNLLTTEIPVGEEYTQYIIAAFGGDTKLSTNGYISGYNKVVISKQQGQWWDCFLKPKFVSRGKDSFKSYINTLNVAEFEKLKIQSSLSGFIPVELALTVDGLSGIRIYNKLQISQRFLPPAYPNALKFLIRGLNHKVEGNKWTTDIATISTSLTDQTQTKKEIAPPKSNKGTTKVEIKGPIRPIDPNQKLKIIDKRKVAGVIVDTRTYGKYQSIDWLVSELNINTQDTWKKFLNTLEEKYPGYTLSINATYRTYQRSIELKAQNSKNATPGRSPHNYAYAVDMNVIDPTGVTYRKKDRKPWVESGIPKVAKSLGMRWGGDFKSYVDCVHFDVTRVTNASLANAAKDNEGLPQSQWDTKNTNYV